MFIRSKYSNINKSKFERNFTGLCVCASCWIKPLASSARLDEIQSMDFKILNTKYTVYSTVFPTKYVNVYLNLEPYSVAIRCPILYPKVVVQAPGAHWHPCLAYVHSAPSLQTLMENIYFCICSGQTLYIRKNNMVSTDRSINPSLSDALAAGLSTSVAV